MTDDRQPNRDLWNPQVQGRSADDLTSDAEAALRREWQRAWEIPLPFYRDRYEAAGFTRDDMPPLEQIPRATKPDHRADEAANPRWGTHRAVGLDTAARLGVSTGTTGKPTYIFYGRNDVDAMVESSARQAWRVGMRPGTRFTHAWPLGIYPTGVQGGRSYLEIGALEIAVGPPFSKEAALEHLQIWEELEPDAFQVTASQFATYESVAAANGIDFPALLDGSILVYLEASCQYDGPRTRIEDAYGVRLHNLSGASEVPAFSVSDCRFHNGFRVPGDHFVVEVVDPETGIPVPDGERGSLVVSAFGLDAFYLRYDIEDIVVRERGECPCGETGPRYRFIGRGADGAVVGDTTIMPLDVQLALDAHGAPEFQFDAGDTSGALRIRVEGAGNGAEVEGLLADALAVSVDAEVVEPGSLPRSAFKPRRVAS
ncbi:MAG: hypothetical protein R3A49_04435 [Acidimicrobiia bacterium]